MKDIMVILVSEPISPFSQEAIKPFVYRKDKLPE